MEFVPPQPETFFFIRCSMFVVAAFALVVLKKTNGIVGRGRLLVGVGVGVSVSVSVRR